MRQWASRRLRAVDGFSLMEILIEVTILVLVLMVISNSLHSVSHGNVKSKNKAFAAQKSMQMMEELRGVAANSSLVTIDDYNDTSANNYVLTISSGVTSPGDPISGNRDQTYTRQIEVLPVPNDPMARTVYVRVYLAATQELLAEAMSILYDSRKQYVPTQVFDIYLLAIENGSGSWIAMSAARSTFNSVIQDLQSRKPGLEIRPHWITRMAYGRDPYYTPYLNQSVSAEQPGALPYVYIYPGKVFAGGSWMNFDPGPMTARINVDGTIRNGSVGIDDGPVYSLADKFNHAVRYPDELNMYNQAKNAAKAAGQNPPEVSLRMLLEEMNSQPYLFQNAIIVNINSRTIMPPMRNYSDAAKDLDPLDPAYQLNVRVVTHPEQLHYNSGDGVNLRVYAYVADADPSTFANQDVQVSSITVWLSGVPLSDNPGHVTVRKLVGNSGTGYQWLPGHDTSVENSNYSVSNVGGGTLITLNNTRLIHTQAGNGTGLNSNARLYDMEYIPSAQALNGSNPAFIKGTSDLADNDPSRKDGPKNTARWVIQIKNNRLPDNSDSLHPYTIETRIGSPPGPAPLTPGQPPSNLSRTYVWVAQPPPITEQYQFLGDPRHMPYVDVQDNAWQGNSGGGYNRYFRDLASPLFPKAVGPYDGKENGNAMWIISDVPRFFQVYRSGLLSAGVVHSALGIQGYDFDLGDNVQAYNISPTNPWRAASQPWDPWHDPSHSVPIVVDEELAFLGPNPPEQKGDPFVMQAGTAPAPGTPPNWVSLPWLGELYPDNQYNGWVVNGNLPAAGTGAGSFYRAYPTDSSLFDSFPGPPPNIGNHPDRRGGSSLMHGSSDGVNPVGYDFYFPAGAGNGGSPIIPMRQTFGLTPLLLPDQILGCSMILPSVTDSDGQSPDWNDTDFGPKLTISNVETYYNSNRAGQFSALYESSDDTTHHAAFFITNGLCPPKDSGTQLKARLSLTEAIRGYMTAGALSGVGHIPQIPRIALQTPLPGSQSNNPSSISVQWSLDWKRWDDAPYTEAPVYSGYVETGTNVLINIKYSPDAGKRWLFAGDNSKATAGLGDPGHPISGGPSGGSYSWNVSDASAFPEGNYLVSVEGYRLDASGTYVLPHYAYNQVSFSIDR